MFDAFVLGLTLYTQHVGEDAGQYHSHTPGIYAVVDDTVVVGTVRNSLGNRSVYVGGKINVLGLDLVVGGITGYPRAPVVPMASVGLSWKPTPAITNRVQWQPPTPYSTSSFTFSVEHKF